MRLPRALLPALLPARALATIAGQAGAQTVSGLS